MKRPRLRPDDVLERAPDVQLADLPVGRTPVGRTPVGRTPVGRTPVGRLLVRHSRGMTVIDGVTRADAEAVAAAVDGRRTAQEVTEALAGRHATREAVRLLRRLDGELLHRVPPAVEGSVRVIANGAAGTRLVGELTRRGLEVTLTADGTRDAADLVIVALENTSYRRLFELQEAYHAAGVTSLWVTFDADGTRVGPATVPGATPCFACAQRVHFGVLGLDPDAIGDLRTLAFDDAAWPALRSAATEARRLLAGQGELRARAARYSPAGVSVVDVPPHAACRLDCCAASAAPEVVEALERQPLAAAPAGDLVASVGILGGGTAGYLTALALRRAHPHVRVTLIESSAVPVIGVGEATTPLMPQFLHADLGIPARELFAEVRPTLKLGIRFYWGDDDFSYPFGPVRPLDAYAHDGHVRPCSLRAMLMAADRVPADARFGTEVAYHLDNARFVRFLAERARAAGVEHVDATVVDAELTDDGEDVRALVTDDGRRLAFDLYVDASGFRSLLLEKTLGSPWVSFGDSLFTDRAWVATVPLDGVVRPYTTATAMDAGWCWSTPQAGEDHRGYVYASAFLDDDEALAEMRAKNPGMGEPRRVTFRAGRHEHFWRGNVVALGNAYGFVEPLESTALHMLVRQIGLLLSAFPLRRGERGVQGVLNRKVAATWDYLRWFLALHFKHNRGLDTPFWRACREEADVSTHGELLAAFTERGPLSHDPAARRHFDYPDPLWGPEGIDVVLLGQHAPSRLPRPSIGREEWRRRVELCRRVAERSPYQDEALALFDAEPRWLDRLEAAFTAAGPAFR